MTDTQPAVLADRAAVGAAARDVPSPTDSTQRNNAMNSDILEGKWKQVRGEAKAWWGKLTDDDLDRAAGKFDVLAGLLQEKYGYSRERAADEIDRRVTDVRVLDP